MTICFLLWFLFIIWRGALVPWHCVLKRSPVSNVELFITSLSLNCMPQWSSARLFKSSSLTAGFFQRLLCILLGFLRLYIVVCLHWGSILTFRLWFDLNLLLVLSSNTSLFLPLQGCTWFQSTSGRSLTVWWSSPERALMSSLRDTSTFIRQVLQSLLLKMSFIFMPLHQRCFYISQHLDRSWDIDLDRFKFSADIQT